MERGGVEDGVYGHVEHDVTGGYPLKSPTPKRRPRHLDKISHTQIKQISRQKLTLPRTRHTVDGIKQTIKRRVVLPIVCTGGEAGMFKSKLRITLSFAENRLISDVSHLLHRAPFPLTCFNLAKNRYHAFFLPIRAST